MWDQVIGRAQLFQLANNLRKLGANSASTSTVSALVELSGIFDRDYYMQTNPDVSASGMDAMTHYLEFGYKEKRSLAPWLPHIPTPKDNESICEYLQRISKKYPPLDKEQKTIIRQGSYETAYDMPLFVNWGLTSMCNYNCSYCFGHEKVDKDKFTPFGNIVNALDNIAALNRPSYDFVIGGGEPTIYPHFIETLYLIASKFSRKVDKVQIITNGSRNDDFYTQLKDIGKLIPLSMEVSIHTDHVKPERIYDLIGLLSDSVEIVFPLMFNPVKFELVQEIYSGLLNLRKSHHFGMAIATLREPPDFSLPDKRYTAALRDWQVHSQNEFNKIASSSKTIPKYKKPRYPKMFCEVIDDGQVYNIQGGDRHLQYQQGLFNFREMYCSFGTHMVNIWASGIFRGTVCRAMQPLGNIFEKGILRKLDHFQMVKCPFPSCGCRANDPLMKFRDKHEADSYLHMVKSKQNRLIKDS